MSENLLRPIVEMAYLNTSNTPRYRLIMRFFYEQHQRLRYWLKAEEVYEGVLAYGLLEDYTLEQCQQDLTALVNWKNLVPRHDGGRSSTIEEYLRKKFRYQMTPYSVEIERMVAGLEKIRGYGGSLEPTLLDDIAEGVGRLVSQEGRFAAGEALALWTKTYQAFVKLTENASDYIASLQSSRAEELMATEAFLVYKNTLTQYLQNFVQELQRSAFRIEGLLGRVTPETVRVFFGHVLRDLENRPQIEESLSEEEERQRLQMEWESLVRWFLGDQGENSDVRFLEQATKDTIARIVRCALRIQEKRRSGFSRKGELDYLGRWFASLTEVDEAHRLAAYAFGLYRTRHFQGHDDKGSESAEIGMWDCGPNIRALRSRSRQRRKEGATQAVVSRDAEKARAKEAYLVQHRAEEELIRGFVAKSPVSIGEMGTVTPFLRSQLLYWIGRCMNHRSKGFRTPDGVRIRLTEPPAGQRATLVCEDGELVMPDFILHFEVDAP